MPSYDNKVLTGDQLVYFSGLIKTALAAKQDALTIGGSGVSYNASTNHVATIEDINAGMRDKQDALVFNSTYNATTNPVATMADIPSIDLSVGDSQDSGFLSFDGQELTINWDQPLGEILTFSEDGNGDPVTLASIIDEIFETLARLSVDQIIVSEDPISGDVVYLDALLDDKQDALVFNTAYNASSNKVATMADITSALGGISSFSFEIVNSLPQSDISTSKIYLVAKQTSGTNQVYTEYAYVNNAWEIIGDTSMTIDTLSNAEVATIWSAATAT